MQRRTFLAGSAALGGALAAPSLVRAATQSVLRFIPQSDLTVLDPHWTTAYVTRNHAFMVFDTLYGMDGAYRATPQMAEGAVTEDDGRTWKIALRQGLFWHDGTPVLARDCVASIARWGRKDGFGQALMAATDQLSATDDRTIVFRLKAPFPLLPDALGKCATYMPAMMPERLARTDPNTQVTEMIGSGPFRYLADERVPGARNAYARFEKYLPRSSGRPDWTAGPKIVHFDRVVWTTTPDPATAAAAVQSGEQDWWDYATADLLPMLRADKHLRVVVQDPSGQMAMLRMNHLQPPFDNPGVRRALLDAVSQSDYMQAVVGTDPAMWHDQVGIFTPGTPMASTAGLEVLDGPRDMDRAKAELKAAGYKGEKVALLAATDFPVLKAMADVGADMLQRAGMAVDYQALDWGTVLTRRTSRKPVGEGGWSCFFTAWAGTDTLTPAGHISLRANGTDAWFGWPSSPRLEQLRADWFAASGLEAQKAICADMQRQAFQDVPYVPLGQYMQATAYRTELSGVLNGFAIFWNVQRS